MWEDLPLIKSYAGLEGDAIKESFLAKASLNFLQFPNNLEGTASSGDSLKVLIEKASS